MKAKFLVVILISMISITFVQAQSYVFGFSYSGTETFSKGTRTDYYFDGGRGGNQLTWSVQNRADFAASLTTVIRADYSQQSSEEQRLLTGNTADGYCELTKGVRSNPYEWDLDFTFMWDDYANLVEKTVWFNYWANDWDPDDYKGTRSVKKEGVNRKK